MVKLFLTISLHHLCALLLCSFRALEQIRIVSEPLPLALDHAYHSQNVDHIVGTSLFGLIIDKMGINMVTQIFEHDTLLLLDLFYSDIGNLADHFVVL